MLAVQEPQVKKIKYDKNLESAKPKDIIVFKEEQDIIEYNKNGDKIIRKAYKKVNVTKLVNETKKLIKIDNAQAKLDEIKKAITEL